MKSSIFIIYDYYSTENSNKNYNPFINDYRVRIPTNEPIDSTSFNESNLLSKAFKPANAFYPNRSQNKLKPFSKNELSQKGEKQLINLDDVYIIYNNIDCKWKRYKDNSNDKKYTN